ncbi:hypothetical protein O0L34_g17325 [Tuta absoluta]|nr:hypothetical protein O0L34_g17325 [Tuta absoluta]
MWAVLLFIVAAGATCPKEPSVHPKKPAAKACPDNEYWEKCPIDCPSEYCSKHFNKIKCPAPECSAPSCRCKKGYLRDDNTNRCVSDDKCPLQCGYNEKLVDCRTICPPQNCDLPYTEYYCTEESKRCEQGCDCIEDHFRNASSICVPSDQCAPPLQCGYNEKLVDCRTICPPQNCDLPYTDYYCTEESKRCEQGCDCIEDHFRNASSICVPSDQCAPPLQCGYNEKLVDCRTICPPQNCDLPYTDYYCTEESKRCEQGCDCIEDHFRNASGICVPSDQCAPPLQCGYNEKLVDCRTICPPQNCDLPYTEYYCTEESKRCEQGCDCIEDHFRNASGICVPSDQCAPPLQCGYNEKLVDCRTICPPQNCDLPYTDYYCTEESKICKQGCDCIEDHFRNASGICVPSDQCAPPDPLQCGINEELVDCKRTCPPQVCEAQYVSYLCAAPDPEAKCEPGCMCIEGHLRDESDTCIPVEDCPPPPWLIVDPIDPVCPENEVYTNCSSTCPEDSSCTDITDCKSGCQCQEDYIRNPDGSCEVSQKCGVNEELLTCLRSCPPDTCDTLYFNYPCANPEGLPCQSGCRCKQSYLRYNGTCVAVDECPPLDTPKPVCSENETYVDCAGNAPNCKPGCRCKDGYLRDLDGNCVRPQQAGVCSPNESYDDCVPYCPPGRACPAVLTPGCEPGCKCTEGYQRNQDSVCSASPSNSTSLDISKLVCSENETNVDCAASAPNCKPGCRCKDGYLRDLDGNCVRPQQLPVCPPNEFYDDCVPYCPPGRACPAVLTPGCTPGCKRQAFKRNQEEEDCSVSPKPPTPPTCPANEYYYNCVPYCPPGRVCAAVLEPGCEPGCKCKQGYKRNGSGKCVLIPQPPTPPTCPANEYYYNCVPYCPPGRACAAVLEPGCEPGCKCKQGYERNGSGKCVLVSQPPTPPTCPANEYYYSCVPYCPPGRACAAVLEPGCEPGCKCKQGYERNGSGKCVLVPQPPTPPTCPANEYYYNCVPYCPPGRVCAAVLEPGCEPGCKCKQGYERNGTGKCVLVSQPPTPPTCPANEYYYNCVPYCPPGRACAAVLEPGCEPGCKCKQGYERNGSGKCVLIPQPPTPPTCPANEYYYNCVPYCPPGRACAAVLEPGCEPGCKCKQGYERNGSGGCVLIQNTCNANETYVQCQFDCPTIFCPTNEYSSLIACSPPYPCPPGCVCSGENVRRRSQEDRTCIPIEECPAVNCSKPHEVWDYCPSSCLAENCEDANKPQSVCYEKRRYCQPKCICEKDYYRNASGICVPASECLQNTCGANELYSQCSVDCPTVFCPENEFYGLIACDPPYPCPSGCSCKANFKRLSQKNRTCVPDNECPPVNCSSPNEMWDYCPSACLAEKCEDMNKPVSVCTEERPYCRPKCVCDKGHYKNSNGTCVPASKCPKPKCEGNQTEVYCPTFICPNRFCPVGDDQTQIACKPPRDCPSGCGCDIPYRYRSEEDLSCVLAEDCPPQECTRPNEEWDPCPQCLVESCADADVPQTGICNTLIHNCEPKCVCKKGYFRNDNQTCVSKEECSKPKCEGNQTEVYCPTFKCPNRFCPVGDDQTQIACKPPRDCPSGCGCDIPYRYRSEEDLSCVLAEDCPPQECTRPNEEWDPCPQCLAESCADADVPQTGICNTLIHNCEPKCVCKKGYFRNDNQTCVSKEECSKPKCEGNQTEVYCPTFKCPNRFCPVGDDQTQIACKPPRDCPSGCGCDIPYRYRSEEDLSCVLAEDCPPQECTRPNEEWDPCPQCLAESCADAAAPQTGVCNTLIHNCEPKCVCKKGYFRNDNQTCVSKEECFKCKENERYVACKASCPTDFCPEDDNQDLIACDPPLECTGGCICKLNYRLKSYEDPVCIPVEQCPKVNCTRPKEVWATCPSPCLQESCESAYSMSKTCNYLVHYCNPKCICEKGHFRNGSRICVPKRDCPSPRPKSSDIKT